MRSTPRISRRCALCTSLSRVPAGIAGSTIHSSGQPATATSRPSSGPGCDPRRYPKSPVVAVCSIEPSPNHRRLTRRRRCGSTLGHDWSWHSFSIRESVDVSALPGFQLLIARGLRPCVRTRAGRRHEQRHMPNSPVTGSDRNRTGHEVSRRRLYQRRTYADERRLSAR